MWEDRMKQWALEAGFDLVGIASSALPEEASSFLAYWLERGYHGEMGYMENPRRLDIRRVYPWARSVICVGLYYLTETELDLSEPGVGRISCYAWGEVDYHDFMRRRLEGLARRIELETGQVCRVASDSFPIMEKAYARAAGLGWIGKNTLLIHQGGGSYFFLGEVITSLALRPDIPAPDRCGSCRLCLEACPTGALVAPGVLDSRRCISYLTIEFRGVIERSLSEKLGNHLFGCDICQEVCPWNRKPRYSRYEVFRPRELAYTLEAFSSLLGGGFRRLFGKTAVSRTRRRGFLRNLLIAMENSPLDFSNFFERASKDGDPVVGYHAKRALGRGEFAD